ncbi:MAG: adenosine deaminase [Lachnospiraceae bacterium]
MTTTNFPKIDLHLHIDGSLSLPCFQTLASNVGLSMTDAQIRKAVIVSDTCQSLPEYLQCFELPTRLLQTEKALTLSTLDLIRNLEEQGLFYAELRFAPQHYTKQGLTQQQTVAAVLKGVDMAKKAGFHIRIGILLCMLVNGSPANNQETAELAVAYKDIGIAGLDLAGPESAVPMSEFQPLFHFAYQSGLPFTIHAGECGDYENISRAILVWCTAYRTWLCGTLFRGLHASVRKEQTILEMCPTSNVQTKAVPTLSEHPIRMFFDRGIAVTVNTDNMTVSNTTLDKEYALLKKQFHFTDQELAKMSQTALRGTFCKL